MLLIKLRLLCRIHAKKMKMLRNLIRFVRCWGLRIRKLRIVRKMVRVRRRKVGVRKLREFMIDILSRFR